MRKPFQVYILAAYGTKEEILQKRGLREYRCSQASPARVIGRLRAKQRNPHESSDSASARQGTYQPQQADLSPAFFFSFHFRFVRV